MFRRALLGIASALLLPISLQAQSESTSSPSPLEVTVNPQASRGSLSAYLPIKVFPPRNSPSTFGMSRKNVLWGFRFAPRTRILKER